jgi:RND family efflux transporter MFP subunit
MPTHDDELPREPSPIDNRNHSEYPDATSRREGGVSIEFSADTGRRTKRIVGIAAALLGAGFLLVLLVRHFHDAAVADAGIAIYSQPPRVDVVIARSATVGQDLVLPGETAAWYETTVYARVNGYVLKWLVDIGDHVKKGQTLAMIETPELDAELEASRAQLEASEAQVQARKSDADFTKTTNERWRDSPQGVVSEQERDSKKAEYQGARARLSAAIAQVALDKSKVDQYRALTEFKQVKAPFDGTITERKIDVGNLVTAGSASTTTPLYRMAQTNPLRIFVDVPQSASGELMRAGVPAEIRADGTHRGTFSGSIARTAESLNPQARTMKVEVDMPNSDHALVPGMYVKVAFRLPPRGVVEVPAAALLFHAGGPEVARVDGSGKVSFAHVTIARDEGGMVELATGAEPGDRLVLNISTQIAAGQKVAAQGPPERGLARDESAAASRATASDSSVAKR